jgi:hypothetical protein
MEACGGSQHWARKLTAMGHQGSDNHIASLPPFQ